MTRAKKKLVPILGGSGERDRRSRAPVNNYILNAYIFVSSIIRAFQSFYILVCRLVNLLLAVFLDFDFIVDLDGCHWHNTDKALRGKGSEDVTG